MIGTLLVVVSRGKRSEGLWLAASAGALWGASDISIKALSGRLDDLGAGVLVHPLALGDPAPVALRPAGQRPQPAARRRRAGDRGDERRGQRADHRSGPIVFGEPMPDDTLGLAVRLAAFVLVIAATALTPPPVPAEAAEPQPATP